MKWVATLNLATGSILVIVGIIHFFNALYPAGFSWFIFGSMYLVMDSYQTVRTDQTFERRATIVRKLFSLAGFVAAIALLIYTLFSF